MLGILDVFNFSSLPSQVILNGKIDFEKTICLDSSKLSIVIKIDVSLFN